MSRAAGEAGQPETQDRAPERSFRLRGGPARIWLAHPQVAASRTVNQEQGSPRPPQVPEEGTRGDGELQAPVAPCLVQAHRGMVSWAIENRSGTVGSPGWITGQEAP